MKLIYRAMLTLCLAAGMPVFAQWGALANLAGGGGGDVDGVISSGTKIIVFTTIATDLAMASALQMLEAFPPEKVEAIKEKCIKYNELKANRGAEGQLDSESATVASDALTAMAELSPDSYIKEKASVVRSAYTKMGLAVAADMIAATQLPTFVTSGAKAISSLASNPLQLRKIGKLRMVVATVTVLVKAVPSQIKSIKTVRAMAKTIAAAENIKLGEPKTAVTSIDPDALNKQVENVEKEG